MSTEPALRQLAPSGMLRIGINLGNPVIAQRSSSGEPGGVGPSLGRALAQQAALPLRFVLYETAGVMADGVRRDEWDVAFLAVDPVRGNEIAFTAPYVLIEGAYMVAEGSPIRSNHDVDRDGVRVAVGDKTAYDLHLTRELRHATLVRASSSKAAIEQFMSERLEVAAGVRQPLADAVRDHPGHRLLTESFMVIRQAAGVPKDRPLARDYVDAFVGDAKRSGLVAKALRESGHADVTVAP